MEDLPNNIDSTNDDYSGVPGHVLANREFNRELRRYRVNGFGPKSEILTAHGMSIDNIVELSGSKDPKLREILEGLRNMQREAYQEERNRRE